MATSAKEAKLESRWPFDSCSINSYIHCVRTCVYVMIVGTIGMPTSRGMELSLVGSRSANIAVSSYSWWLLASVANLVSQAECAAAFERSTP